MNTNSDKATINLNTENLNEAIVQPEQNKAVTINLAWLVILIPLMGIGLGAIYIARKISFVKMFHPTTT